MQHPLIDVTVEYCVPWNYTTRAVSLTEEVLGVKGIEIFVRSWKMIQSSGGAFEVVVNGDLVFSKKQLKRHAEPGEVQAAIRRKLESLLPPGMSIPEPDDEGE